MLYKKIKYFLLLLMFFNNILLLSQTKYCLDQDSDLFGNPDYPVWANSQPAGYVTDCSDEDDGCYCTASNLNSICHDLCNICKTSQVRK